MASDPQPRQGSDPVQLTDAESAYVRAIQDRDLCVRLFNRLEKAVTDHKAAMDGCDCAELGCDEKLYAAHRAIMRDAAKGPEWRPERREHVRPADAAVTDLLKKNGD